MIAGTLIAVTACALAVSLLRAVPQSAAIRRVTELLGGILLLMTLLQPLLRLQVGDLGEYLERYRPRDAAVERSLRSAQKETARLITEQTRTYILDKARELGSEVEVQIELAALSEHYQYPYRVTLRGRWTEAQRVALSEYLARTLGIPKERQLWQEE